MPMPFYRNVETLREKGMIQRFDYSNDWSRKRTIKKVCLSSKKTPGLVANDQSVVWSYI